MSSTPTRVTKNIGGVTQPTSRNKKRFTIDSELTMMYYSKEEATH
jgi:hypothetical protein